jgi:hypothetical protein
MADRLKTRMRLNIKKTSQKAGYSPDFTVEAEWVGQDFNDTEADEEALYRFGILIKELEKKAFDEVNYLNVREGYPIIGTEIATRETETFGNVTTVSERVERVDEETGEITHE